MKCFSVIQKPKRRPHGGETLQSDLTTPPGNMNETDQFLSLPNPGNPSCHPILPSARPPRSFRSRVRAIQNAQRFIRNTRSSGNPSKLLRSSTHGDTMFNYGIKDNYVISSTNAPMPLPSPPSASNAYRLPLPSEHVARPLSPRPMSSTSTSTSPSSSSSSTTSSMSMGARSNMSHVSHSTMDSSTLPLDETRNPGVSMLTERCDAHKAVDPQPLPLPKLPATAIIPGLTHFTYEEVASACDNFSPNATSYGDGICYAGSLRVNGKPKEILAVLVHNNLGFSKMVSDISVMGRRHGSHFCKLIGFTSGDLDAPHAMVYEMLPRGSLSSILFNGVSALDWSTRMKIACGVAHSLTVLHEMYPEKGLYCDIRTSHFQVDEDYTSKLVGNKFERMLEHGDYSRPSNARMNAYNAPETIMKGEVTLKSHVWSYGVILLEILSGKQHMDEMVSKDEKQNLLKWAKPFLNDDGRLFLVMDPKLQGKFPSKGARLVADLVLSCLHKDPVKRPNMKEILEMMKSVQEMRYKTTRFPSKETLVTRGSMLSSMEPISMSSPLTANWNSSTLMTNQVTSYGIKSLDKFDVVQGPQLRPLIIPSRGCASIYAMDDHIHHHHPQQEYKSAPLGHVSGF